MVNSDVVSLQHRGPLFYTYSSTAVPFLRQIIKMEDSWPNRIYARVNDHEIVPGSYLTAWEQDPFLLSYRWWR